MTQTFCSGKVDAPVQSPPAAAAAGPPAFVMMRKKDVPKPSQPLKSFNWSKLHDVCNYGDGQSYEGLGHGVLSSEKGGRE